VEFAPEKLTSYMEVSCVTVGLRKVNKKASTRELLGVAGGRVSTGVGTGVGVGCGDAEGVGDGVGLVLDWELVSDLVLDLALASDLALGSVPLPLKLSPRMSNR
jgi:hypothetical protein